MNFFKGRVKNSPGHPEHMVFVPAQEAVKNATFYGFMNKEGGSVKSWKNRFVVFNGKTLYYYKSENSEEQCGEIHLPEIMGIEIDKDSHPKKKNLVRIELVKRTFLFQAPNEDDMYACFDAVEDAIALLHHNLERSNPINTLSRSTGTAVTRSSGHNSPRNTNAKTPAAMGREGMRERRGSFGTVAVRGSGSSGGAISRPGTPQFSTPPPVKSSFVGTPPTNSNLISIFAAPTVGTPPEEQRLLHLKQYQQKQAQNQQVEKIRAATRPKEPSTGKYCKGDGSVAKIPAYLCLGCSINYGKELCNCCFERVQVDDAEGGFLGKLCGKCCLSAFDKCARCNDWLLGSKVRAKICTACCNAVEVCCKQL